MNVTDILNEEAKIDIATGATLNNFKKHNNYTQAAGLFMSYYDKNDYSKVSSAVNILEKDKNINPILKKILKRVRNLVEKEAVKKGGRSDNEKEIADIITDFISYRKLDDIISVKRDVTKLDRTQIAKLKKDGTINISGQTPVVYEAKKGTLATLKSKKGLLFAELHKKFANKKKADVAADPKLSKERDEHNKWLGEYFPEKMLRKIESDMGTKPYLIFGGTTKDDIFVAKPSQYDLKMNIYNNYAADRIAIQAHLKPGTPKLPTLREFLKSSPYPRNEEEILDFTKELLNGET